MNRLVRVSFLMCSLVFVACSVDVPSDVIPRSRMERILYDYHQAIAMAETSDQDVERMLYVLTQKVFEKYGVTEAEFDSSMVWYSGHADYLSKMYVHIDERMQAESSRLGLDTTDDVYANLSETGDTAVIWRMTNLWLKNKKGENLLKYTLKPDTSFHQGDTYMLRFRNLFVTQDSRCEGYVMLVARFDNDSTASAVTRIGGNYDGNIQIHPSELTNKHKLRSLHLYFYCDYTDEPESPFRLWMLSSPTLIRFHHHEKQVSEEISPSDEQEQVDSVSLPLEIMNNRTERLSPEQMRDSHEGEHTINVQKHRKVVLPANRRMIQPAQRR